MTSHDNLGNDTPIHDVIIAGAGPVGLFLACELRLAGCSVLVLERAQDPHSPLKRLPFGRRGLSVPTIEGFDRRGLLDDLTARASGPDMVADGHWLGQARRPAGHFAGIPFFGDQVDTGRWPWRLPGPVGSMAADMASIETVLAIRAQVLGAAILRGHGVETLEAMDEGVIVQAAGRFFRARWLVGCDGGRSRVRKAAGFDFAGTDPEFTGYSALLELADPAALRPGRHHTPNGMYTYSARGMVAIADFDGGAHHRREPTREHVEAVLRKVSGVPVTVAALRLATTWTDRAYQATGYRRGRVLLAGDAAHVHSPLGGQGLNLGLGDAINLGWKLAATIRGYAPDDLLDSYARERMPVGAEILDWSRAQVALMRPSPGSRALEAIVRELIGTGDGATWFAGRVWGVGLRHDLGDGHALVGRSAPDFALTDGGRVNERLRDGRGLLLDFAADPSLRALGARWGDRIGYVSCRPADGFGLAAALVRPDGMVAWACDDASDLGQANQAATRWFGTAGSAA